MVSKQGGVCLLKKTSKYFLLFLCASILLIGCGRPAAEPAKVDTPTSDTPKSSDVIEVSFGHGFMPETPHHQSALKFKEMVEEKSDGKLVVNIFPSDQLGSAREQFEGLQIGTQQVALLPTARISGFVPELQLFDLPFLFPSREKAYELMDGDVGKELLGKLTAQKVKGVAFYEDGFKHFTANSKIEGLKDFNGLKFRTMESPIIMEQFKKLGANPTPIDFTELYNSLQQGVVDGQENPLVTIKNMKFYEVQDYVILSGHGYLGHVLMFSQAWFDSLPNELQQILEETGKELAAWQRAEVQKEESQYLEEIKKHGTEVIELSEVSKAELRDATKSVHELYKAEFGSDLLDKVHSSIGN